MEVIVFAFLVLIYIAMCLIEHKQKMEHLEFEEKVYRLKHQFLDDYINDKKENSNDERDKTFDQ